MTNRSQNKTKGEVQLQFTTSLRSVGPKGAWTCLQLTKEQSGKLGKRGRVAVVGSLNGFAIRAFLAPMGDGTHGTVVNKSMQAGAGVKPGDKVKVVLEIDTEPRTVAVPSDLNKALAEAPRARAVFDELSFTHKKDYVMWITTAKQLETRARRVAETVRLLSAGIKWKDR